MPSSTRVLHIATWNYFTSFIPRRLRVSPKAVKEVILTEINDLVQELWRTSSDVGASFFAMRRLLETLVKCKLLGDVCLMFFLVIAVDLADKN